jgi:hypothetical protein
LDEGLTGLKSPTRSCSRPLNEWANAVKGYRFEKEYSGFGTYDEAL